MPSNTERAQGLHMTSGVPGAAVAEAAEQSLPSPGPSQDDHARERWVALSLRRLGALARSSGWIAAGGVGTAAFRVAQVGLLARYLGSGEFGVLVAIMGASALVMFFVDFRSWEVCAKVLPERLSSRHSSAARDIAAGLILLDLTAGTIGAFILAVVSSHAAVVVLHDTTYGLLIVLFSVSLPFAGVAEGACAGILRATGRFHWLSGRACVVALVRLIVVGGAVLLGCRVPGVIVALVLAEVANAALSLSLAACAIEQECPSEGRAFEISAIFRSLSGLRPLLAQVWISSTIKGFQGRLDVPILSALSSPTTVGVYRLASELAAVVARIANPIQLAILPEFVRLTACRRKREFRALAGGVSLVLALLTLPLLAAAASVSPWIVQTVGGADYQSAAFPLVLLAGGYGVNTVLCWTRSAVVAWDMVGAANIVSLSTAIFGLVGYAVAVPRWGAVGAAGVTGLVLALTAPLTLLVALALRRAVWWPGSIRR